MFNDLLCVGDTVKPADETWPLRCGCGEYGCAVVVQRDPLVLVSEEADMRWESTLDGRKFNVIGKASEKTLKDCMKRL